MWDSGLRRFWTGWGVCRMEKQRANSTAHCWVHCNTNTGYDLVVLNIVLFSVQFLKLHRKRVGKALYCFTEAA